MRITEKLGPPFLLLILVIFSDFCHAALDDKVPVKVEIVMDSLSPGFLRTRQAFRKELEDLLGQEFEVTFSQKEMFVGDWTTGGVKNAVDAALADPEVDIVLGIGVMSSNEISQRKQLPKPAFAPFVMNLELQGLKDVDGTSGVNNLNYLAFPTNLPRDFSVFHEFHPFDNLAVLVNGYVLRAIPSLGEAIRAFAQEEGIHATVYPVWDSAEELLQRLPNETQAVYAVTLTQLSDEEIKKLAQGLIDRRIPAFSLFSKTYIPSGFMLTMSPDTDLPRLLRRVALNIQRVLLGENPSSLEVRVSESNQLVVNMKTVKEVGISPPWDLLREAVLYEGGYELQSGMHFDLVDAVDYGLKENLNLSAAKRNLAVGREDVNLARSRLFPQVNVGAALVRIDKDRAEASFGILPENGAWGLGSASQMIYSNQAIGKVKVEKRLQHARGHEYLGQRLDIVLLVSQAYLNLLRAKTIETIQRQNLERTRSHLKLARQMVDVGTARPSEIYRWENQYANDMTRVTVSSYQTRSEETTFKTILNLPSHIKVHLNEVTLNEPYWVEQKIWIEEHVTDDRALEAFIDFSTLDGLYRSEEVKQMRQMICAQAEVLGIAKRSFWAPDVSVEAFASDRFKEWGAGTKTKALFNSTDWAVALNVSFPLYTGGYKSAKKRQACQELQKLQLQLGSLVDRKKEEIRNSAYKLVSSYTAISLSKSAAEAADKNLKLVQESYSKGVVTILDLLDAQNQSLVANLETANAVYDFLSDLMVFQRAVGYFSFLDGSSESEGWLRRLDHYFAKHAGAR